MSINYKSVISCQFFLMSLTPSYQIVIGVAAVLIAYVVMKRRNAAARRPGEPPIVGGAAPFVGHGAKFASDSVALLNECRAKHGDVFTLSMAGQRMTFFCSPRAFETIYRNRQLRFRVRTLPSLMSRSPLVVVVLLSPRCCCLALPSLLLSCSPLAVVSRSSQ